MEMRFSFIKCRIFFPLAGLFLIFSGCATVPYTGRSQLSLVEDSEVLQMSVASYREVLSQSEVIRNTDDAAILNRVGRRIAAAAEEFMRDEGMGEVTNDFNWEFNLINDDEVINAWCMPGGKIAFYTGILPYCEDESGVAVVMGHEVAHALARHGAERLSQNLLIQLGSTALSLSLEEEPEMTQSLAYIAFGLGSQIGFILPYSRTHEYEADQIGLILTARAGYDPRNAIEFWERMKAQGDNSELEFLSTHPVAEDRIKEIKEMMPEALKYYNKYNQAHP